MEFLAQRALLSLVDFLPIDCSRAVVKVVDVPVVAPWTAVCVARDFRRPRDLQLHVVLEQWTKWRRGEPFETLLRFCVHASKISEPAVDDLGRAFDRFWR